MHRNLKFFQIININNNLISKNTPSIVFILSGTLYYVPDSIEGVFLALILII